MDRLFNRMATDLVLAGYSESTRRNYLMHARRFARHFQRCPEELERDHIRRFLFHLIENHNVSRATIRQVRAALRFLYVVTLAKPQEIDWLPPARHQKALPVILSGTEVEALFAAVRHQMHRSILMAMYSGGLRISEACRLLPEDIDSKRMLIHVRCGKGGVDRYTILARRLLDQLRYYWTNCRTHYGGYLFPGSTKLRCACPQTVRKVFGLALQDAGITKDVTPHVLRHCFATHLLESGYDVTLVQALLGHRSLRSTQCYVHLSASCVPRDASPLDILGTPQAARLG
jgi:integrase/recombinase XerD